MHYLYYTLVHSPLKIPYTHTPAHCGNLQQTVTHCNTQDHTQSHFSNHTVQKTASNSRTATHHGEHVRAHGKDRTREVRHRKPTRHLTCYLQRVICLPLYRLQQTMQHTQTGNTWWATTIMCALSHHRIVRDTATCAYHSNTCTQPTHI